MIRLRQHALRFARVAIAWTLVACGSSNDGDAAGSGGSGATGGSTSATTGAGSAHCATLCAAAVDPSCSQDAAEQCQTLCENSYAACPGETDSFFACASDAKFSCDGQIMGCDAEGQAVNDCVSSAASTSSAASSSAAGGGACAALHEPCNADNYCCGSPETTCSDVVNGGYCCKMGDFAGNNCDSDADCCPGSQCLPSPAEPGTSFCGTP
jgi:hypothetical protein